MADWPVAVLWSEAVKPQAGQIGEEQEETSSKSQDKDEDNCKDGQKREQDVLEEDDVLAHNVEKTHVEKQVEPGEGDSEGADLPLAAWSNINIKKLFSVPGHIWTVVDGHVQG